MSVRARLALAAALALCVAVAAARAEYERVYLPTALCNDGTRATYLIERSALGSGAHWVVYLEGGWDCYSPATCTQRWKAQPYGQLMSSAMIPPSIPSAPGLLSADAAENPEYYDANHVFVPYCSSDLWIGSFRHPSPGVGNWSFEGLHIVNEVISSLLSDEGLANASRVIYTGSSAGGVGSINTIDRVADLLPAGVPIFGLIDSGWFLDVAPYKHEACDTIESCPLPTALQMGIPMWHGMPPPSCLDHTPTDTWRCAIGSFLYPTLRTPIVAMQFQSDLAQLDFDGALPITAKTEAYAQMVASTLKQTFKVGVEAFSPACEQHTLVLYPNWLNVTVDGRTVMDVLRDVVAGKTGVSAIDSCSGLGCNPSCIHT